MSLWSTLIKAPSREDYAKGAYGTSMHVNSDGTTDIVTHQNPEPVLRENRELRNDDTYDGNFQGEKDTWGRRVASIPVVVYHQWLHEKGVAEMTPQERTQWMLQRLDDPEWEHLKCVDEKVARKKTRTYMKASTAAPKIVTPNGETYG